MKSIVIFSIVLLLILPLLLTVRAYADFNATDNTYFCNSKDLTIEKNGYLYLLTQEDRYWSSETPQDIATNILNTNYSLMLDNLGKTYHCLKDNGVDPDSVGTLPSYLLDGFNLAKQQNPDKFAQVAPNFSQYVPVPEFGTLVGLVIVLSVIGVVIVSRRSRYQIW